MRFLLFLLLVLSAYANERALYEGEFKTEATGIFLPVKIDGKSCNFLFDTGASFVVLDKSFRHILGEPLSLSEVKARTGLEFASDEIITPNGEIKLEMFKGVSLKLGRLQLKNRYPYLLADLQVLWPFSGEKFCGILGSSFLQQFRWEIDFEKGKIRAFFGDEPYMGPYISQTPIFWSASRIPQINVNFGMQKVAFDIDIGDNGSGRIVKKNVKILKQMGLIEKTHIQSIVTVSALSKSEEFRLKKLYFANVMYPNLVMQSSQQNALGLAFFRRHNIVLDFPFNRLYLQHHKDYAKKQELDKSGIRVILQESKLIVFEVKRAKGAKLKGIKKGDEILSLNGKKVSLFQMRKSLRDKQGKHLFLKIRRDDGVHQASIILGKDPLSWN